MVITLVKASTIYSKRYSDFILETCTYSSDPPICTNDDTHTYKNIAQFRLTSDLINPIKQNDLNPLAELSNPEELGLN
jgi:hypothetical protein